MAYRCLRIGCVKSFAQRQHLLRHVRTHDGLEYNCSFCSSTFTRKFRLDEHVKTIHSAKRKLDEEEMVLKKKIKLCLTCNKACTLLPNLKCCQECFDNGKPCSRCYRCLPARCFSGDEKMCFTCKRKIKNEEPKIADVIDEKFIPVHCNSDWMTVYNNESGNIIKFLQENLIILQSIKFTLTVQIVFSKWANDRTIYSDAFFTLGPFTLINRDDIDIEKYTKNLDEKIGNFTRNGSGWIYECVTAIYIRVAKYSPIQACCSFNLPDYIKNKKAVINIQNSDNMCFKWCILAALHPVGKNDKGGSMNPERVSKYKPYGDELDFTGVEFPVSIHDIPKFERNNDISVSVFSYESSERKDEDEKEKGEFGIVYRPQVKKNTHINLLLIANNDSGHYCLITDMSRLFSRHKSSHKTAHFFCDLCLNSFQRKELLEDHERYCSSHKPQHVYTPENSSMRFQNIQSQLPLPFIIYADIESFLQPSPDALQHHVPASYSYFVKSDHPDYVNNGVQLYRGENVIHHFLNSLRNEEKKMISLIENIKPMKLTVDEELQFKNALFCHICNGEFNDGDKKHRDHCHLTGKFRGSAHQRCNLNYQIPLDKFKIPIFFHNGKNYDFHLFVKDMGNFDVKINVIPQNIENYLQIEWGCHLVFRDSYQFLSTSLAKLTDSLSTNDFRYLEDHFGENSEILKRKGVFPYSWFTDESKFDTTALPSFTDFFDTLNNEDISEQDYQFANQVWNHFKMDKFSDYHDLYLKTDVLLLTCVFESFRKMCLEYFQLDPAHFISLPSFGWQCMLKSTQINLELLSDLNMYLFYENGCRGGISTINHRYAKANNPYLTHHYDSEKETSYIIYIDKNSLYPQAMSDHLPFANFRWEDPSRFNENFILNHPDDAAKGYTFEVDIEYPSHLHDSHNDYPLAAEHVTLDKNDLSPYIRSENYVPSKKLIPNLNDKSHHIVHYRCLKFYLKQGLRITKIHKVISYCQKAWMKPYIDLCVIKRKNAQSNFEKDFWKLLMNSVFGKSMENVRNRTRVLLMRNAKEAMKSIAKNTYKKSIVFDDNLAAIELFKLQQCLSKPVYIGQSILDLSKLYMNDFHYNYISKKYAYCKLLFSDTDSFCYYIKTNDIYKDMYNDRNLFDLSNYSPTSIFFSDENKKVVGKFKDEMCGDPIIEFIGLRPKLYSILGREEYKRLQSIMENEIDQNCKIKDDDKIKRTVKGIQRSVAKKITHEDYKSCLLNRKEKSLTVRQIKNSKHSVNTISQNKIALSPFDDKRFILTNGIDTYAYGHKNLIHGETYQDSSVS